jgi:hypothetical protein
MKEGSRYLLMLSNGDIKEVECLVMSNLAYKIIELIDTNQSANSLVNNFPFWVLKTDVATLGYTPTPKYQIIEELV